MKYLLVILVLFLSSNVIGCPLCKKSIFHKEQVIKHQQIVEVEQRSDVIRATYYVITFHVFKNLTGKVVKCRVVNEGDGSEKVFWLNKGSLSKFQYIKNGETTELHIAGKKSRAYLNGEIITDKKELMRFASSEYYSILKFINQ